MIVLFIGILLFLLLLWWSERKAIVQPRYYRDSEGIKKLGANYHEFDLATVDAKALEGAIYTPENFKETLLYFGGQAQDSVGAMPKLVAQFQGYQIITFNYREYGKSSGIFTQKRMEDDAAFVYEWVKEFYGDVIVVGFSLGTHAASYVAAKYRVKLLLLVAPYYSIKSLIQRRFYLPSFLAFFDYNNAVLIKKCDAALIIISLQDDPVVLDGGALLAKEANNLRLHKELIGYNHGELIFADEVYTILEKYKG